MGRYVVEVDGERYVVTIRETQPGRFEMLTWIASRDDVGDAEPSADQREAFESMIRLLRNSPPKRR